MSVPSTFIQATFQRLTPERQLEIIYHGAALRLSDLNKRYFLAHSKVRTYEEQYQTTLAALDTQGLPNDASFEMHEDYIMWHHWSAVASETQAAVEQLRPLVEQGLPIERVDWMGQRCIVPPKMVVVESLMEKGKRLMGESRPSAFQKN